MSDAMKNERLKSAMGNQRLAIGKSANLSGEFSFFKLADD